MSRKFCCLWSGKLIIRSSTKTVIRLRNPPGPPAKGNAVVLADMAQCAISMKKDAASRVPQAMKEMLP